MNKDMLREYAGLKAQIAEAEARLESIKPLIIEQMMKAEVDKVETGFGNFTLSSTTRWEYSPAVADLQEREKATGVAKKKVSSALRFIAPKDHEDKE